LVVILSIPVATHIVILSLYTRERELSHRITCNDLMRPLTSKFAHAGILSSIASEIRRQLVK